MDKRLSVSACLLAAFFGTRILSAACPGFAFTPPSPAPLAQSNGVIVADLNGDGMPDILLGGASPVDPTSFYVMLGTGGGKFGPATGYGTGEGGLFLGDVDGDGIVDVVVSRAPYGADVYRGDGHGKFSLWSSYSYAVVGVGDVDGDGRADFAVKTSDGISVLLNLGGGQFSAGILAAAGAGSPSGLADFDGDGKADLWYTFSRGFQIAISNGDGTFHDTPHGFGFFPYAEGDFNGDGKADLIGASQNDFGTAAAVLLGNGDGTFRGLQTGNISQGGSSSVSAIAGDFDGDGHTDLLAAGDMAPTESGFLLLYPGAGATLGTPVYVPLGNFQIAAAADLDGDGRTDLVTYRGEVLLAVAPPSSANAVLPTGYLGVDYDGYASAFVEATDLNASRTSGALPPGLQLSPDGSIAGVPTAVGTFHFTVSFTNSGCPVQRLCTISVLGSPPTPVITAVHPDCLTIGTTFEIDGSGFTPGSRIYADGNWLATTYFTSHRLQATVPPLTDVEDSITLTVSDPDFEPAPVSNAFPITIDFGILSPAALPEATLGEPYLQLLDVLIAGTYSLVPKSGYTFSAAGNVPGLTLDASGRLSGTPTAAGTYDLAVSARSGACQIEASFSVTVAKRAAAAACPVRWTAAIRLPIPDPANMPAKATAVADFNRDGLLDIAVLPSDGNCVSIFLGLPDGGFAPRYCVYPEGTAADGFGLFQAVDVDGDGTTDLIVGSHVNFGLGDGTFRPGPEFEGIPLGFADFNRDGKPDYAANDGVSLSVYLGNGDGTFRQTQVTGTSGSQELSGAAIGDFNGDGKPDIAVTKAFEATAPLFYVFLGNGDGTFKTGAPTTLASGSAIAFAFDVNSDGKLDLVVAAHDGSGNLLTLPGKGNGTFGTPIPFSSIAEFIGFADFDGDGKPDLLSGAEGGMRISHGRGDGTFEALPPVYPFGVVEIADIDHDGKPDIVMTGTRRSEVLIFRGKGDGTLEAPTLYGAGTIVPQDALAGDFNGDGMVDFFLPPSTVLLGDGRGGFTSAGTGLTEGPTPTSEIVADFDGDGRLDFAFLPAAPPDTAVMIAWGKGDGTFETPEAVPFSMPFGSTIATGDFNGDGRPDIVVLGPAIQTLVNRGSRRFALSPETSVGALQVVVADFDLDGEADLVVAGNPSTSEELGIRFLRGRGDGTFVPPDAPLPVAAQSPVWMAAGDFDGDGVPDLFASEGAAHAFFHGMGNGQFRTTGLEATGSTGGFYDRGAVGDFNADGTLDVVLADRSPNGDIAVLTGRGDGTFAQTESLVTANGPTALAVGDITASGHDSIAAMDQSAWIFRNESAPLLVGPASLPGGHVGVGYQAAVSSSEGGEPTFRISAGRLPSGFALDPHTGAIAGVTASAGRYGFTVTAKDSGGCTGARKYTIFISGDVKRPKIGAPAPPRPAVVEPPR